MVVVVLVTFGLRFVEVYTKSRGFVCVCFFFTFASFYFLRRFARVVFICLCVCWFVRLAVFVWWYSFVYLRILNISFEWIVFFCCVGKVICFLPFYFQFR